MELTRGRTRRLAASGRGLFASSATKWVGDAPGLVLGTDRRLLVNEAAFAIGEGVGSPADVDAGMTWA